MRINRVTYFLLFAAAGISLTYATTACNDPAKPQQAAEIPTSKQPPVSPQPAPPPPSKLVQIGSNIGFEVGGCQDLGKPFTVKAPGPVDTTHAGEGGAPAGFKFVVTGNNGHGVRSATMSGPDAVSFEAYASGPGTKQNIPLVGEKCVGAQGANVAVDVFAWVKQ